MKFLAILIMVLTAGCAGPKGDVGAAGAKGQQGTPGLGGSNGQDGKDGHDDAPSYPTKFPEYGLCINGVIYAVYSANDGFLAAIPDGVYSSNAIGSACTFKVAGCEVTQ